MDVPNRELVLASSLEELSRARRCHAHGHDRTAFADSGHSLDFINKAFECLDAPDPFGARLCPH
jgi:hypothetical protein